MFGLGPMEIGIIFLIIIIVFGAGKLPSVLGDIGKGLRVFKKEVVDEAEGESKDE